MLYDVLFLVWSWWYKSYNYAKNGANVHAHSTGCSIAIHYEFSSCKLWCLLVTWWIQNYVAYGISMAMFVMLITQLLC